MKGIKDNLPCPIQQSTGVTRLEKCLEANYGLYLHLLARSLSCLCENKNHIGITWLNSAASNHPIDSCSRFYLDCFVKNTANNTLFFVCSLWRNSNVLVLPLFLQALARSSFVPRRGGKKAFHLELRR